MKQFNHYGKKLDSAEAIICEAVRIADSDKPRWKGMTLFEMLLVGGFGTDSEMAMGALGLLADLANIGLRPYYKTPLSKLKKIAAEHEAEFADKPAVEMIPTGDIAEMLSALYWYNRDVIAGIFKYYDEGDDLASFLMESVKEMRKYGEEPDRMA